MSSALHGEWRSRLARICADVAATHGAHIELIDGRELTYWADRDVYVLLLVWASRPDEVVVEIDADEVALFDDLGASLRTLLEERIADAIETKLGRQLTLGNVDQEVSWRIPRSTWSPK
jgi:hypothetical protein